MGKTKLTISQLQEKASTLYGNEYIVESLVYREENRKYIDIRHKCGHLIKSDYSQFNRGDSRCSLCDPHAKIRSTKEYQIKLDRKFGFIYKVESDFIRSDKDITVQHLICGNSFTGSAFQILNGDRTCDYCNGGHEQYTNESFDIELQELTDDIIRLGNITNAKTPVELLEKSTNIHYDSVPCKILAKQDYPFIIPKRVIRGVNDLWTVYPEIAKLLVNSGDGYEYTYSTHTELEFKCPICNTPFFHRPISVYTKYGNIACPHCLTDGVSYPEKVMMNILNQLQIDYVWQATNKILSWCKKYKYDFYIPSIHVIIEIHGAQHYNDNHFNLSIKDIQINDNAKRQLAIDNRINDYIIIDASKSEIEYIKNSIFTSKLINYYDLKNIEWKECHLFASSSIWFAIAKQFDSGMSVDELVKIYHHTKETVYKKLKEMYKLGICHTNIQTYLDIKKFEQSNSFIESRKRRIKCVETNEQTKSPVQTTFHYICLTLGNIFPMISICYPIWIF